MSCCPVAPAPACPGPSTQPQPANRLLDIARIVYRVAITVFVLVIVPKVGLIGLGAGFVTGIAVRTWQRYHNITPEKNNSLPICAQGYAGLLSGTRLPESVALAISAVCLIECITHHTSFYAPFTTFFTGSWIGSQAVGILHSSSRTA